MNEVPSRTVILLGFLLVVGSYLIVLSIGRVLSTTPFPPSYKSMREVYG